MDAHIARLELELIRLRSEIDCLKIKFGSLETPKRIASEDVAYFAFFIGMILLTGFILTA